MVLGANGFIGRRVAAALSASDWATPILAGRRAPVAVGEDHVTRIQLDATDATQLRGAMEGVAGVVNCVAGDTDTIIDGARALFGAAALAQNPRVVHLSSMAVYGDRIGDVDETTHAASGLSPYGSAKAEAERFAHDSPSAVVLRLGIVYGPDSAQWSGRISRLLFARRLGDLGNAGDGYCNLIYVADAMHVILRALRMPGAAGRTFNLGMSDYPTWNEYFSRYAIALGAVPVARISGRRLRIESKLLAPPLKVAELIAAKVAPVLGRRLPAPIPPSLIRLFAQEIRMKVERVEQALDVRWTPLDEGLLHTANWYKAH